MENGIINEVTHYLKSVFFISQHTVYKKNGSKNTMNLRGNEDNIPYMYAILIFIAICVGFVIINGLLMIYNGTQEEIKSNPCFMASIIENTSENCHQVTKLQPIYLGRRWIYMPNTVTECQKYTQCRNGTLIKI